MHIICMCDNMEIYELHNIHNRIYSIIIDLESSTSTIDVTYMDSMFKV